MLDIDSINILHPFEQKRNVKILSMELSEWKRWNGKENQRHVDGWEAQ